MALTASLATAFAAVCTAGAIGFSPGVFSVLLLPSVVMAAVRPEHRLPRVPGDRRWAIGLASMVALLLYTLARNPEHYRLVLAAVIPLSILWPAPAVLRLSLLVCALSLPGAGRSLSETTPWLLGMAAGAAVTLVVLNRATATSDGGRRVANRAAALFAIAALVALIVASTLKPPSNATPSGGDEASPAQPRPSAPYLQPIMRLDGGGAGTGDGMEVVFRVSAPVETLWRTMTFDRYDGRTWTRSAATQPSTQFEALFVPPGPGDGASAAARRVKQQVRVETPFIGVLAAAARLVTAELPERTRAVLSSDGTVFTSPGLRRGATYTARSVLVPTSAETLRPHDSSSSGLPEDVGGLYLAFAASERVNVLAGEIIAGAPTQYDKVKAIQRWLAANTGMARDAPAVPPGADPVDHFLFTDRRGSSVQAATAMTVMLRSLWIPARLAVGYLPGDRSVLGDEFVVRARHAYAWVEVWFPEVGWAAFDPSNAFEGPQTRTESLLERLKRLWWLLLVVLAAVVVWVVIWAVRRARRRRARPWATRCYERLGKAGRRWGRPRRPEETPAEYCATLAADIPDERLVTVGDLVTVAAWSPREPAAESRDWADDVVAAIPRRRSRRAPPG